MSPASRFRNGLAAGRRLRRERDFARLFKVRCSTADHRLIVYVADNGSTRSRMAVSVSRRLGKAVARNRIKRRLREAFRLEQHELPAGCDYLFVARPGGPFQLDEYRRSVRELGCRAVARLRRDARRGGAAK